MSRFIAATVVLLALVGSDTFVSSALGCPMCSQANESAEGPGQTPTGEANVRPKAYMYSILFMMGMPPMILGGFGFAFWRMTRSAAEQAALQADESTTGDV